MSLKGAKERLYIRRVCRARRICKAQLCRMYDTYPLICLRWQCCSCGMPQHCAASNGDTVGSSKTDTCRSELSEPVYMILVNYLLFQAETLVCLRLKVLHSGLTGLLGTSYIIRKVLQSENGSLSCGDHPWFKRRCTRNNNPLARENKNNNIRGLEF